MPAVNGMAMPPPTELRLKFSEGIEIKFTKVKVIGPDKGTIEAGALKLDPNDNTVVSCRLRLHCPTGSTERIGYHNIQVNREPVAGYADRLLAAEALVLVYPVWNEGCPAILRGFFDRVFVSGVSFNVAADGAPVPNFQKLRKLGRSVCLWRQSHDHFPAWRSAEARREAFGAVNARSHRSL
jgi:hypothetical protein